MSAEGIDVCLVVGLYICYTAGCATICQLGDMKDDLNLNLNLNLK